jgi:hypothetical protein
MSTEHPFLRRPELTLCRERQFCSLCHSQGKGWVRVCNVGDLLALRQRYHNEARAKRVYNARRWRAARRHLLAEHPEVVIR